MAIILQINGRGKGLLTGIRKPGVSSLVGPTKSYILPLTHKGGYTEAWSDESWIDPFQTFIITSRRLIKRKFNIDGFGSWMFDWSNFPMPPAFVKDIYVDIKNNDALYDWTLKPKYEPYIGLPERSFAVNVMIDEGTKFITDDNPLGQGTFGLRMGFETIENQQISVGIAPGIAGELPGGGSVSAPFEG